MAPRADDKVKEKDSMAAQRNLTIPRIRVLLAPDMSPYVLPMEKVRTWHMLITMLEKLFGRRQSMYHVKITDGQGNLILEEVWEDLLEPGMCIVVEARQMGSKEDIRESPDYSGTSQQSESTTRKHQYKRQSSLTSTGSIPILMVGSKFNHTLTYPTEIPTLSFEKAGNWDYTSLEVEKTAPTKQNNGGDWNTSAGFPMVTDSTPNQTTRPTPPPSLPPSALSQDLQQCNLLAPMRPPRPPTLSPLIIPDTSSHTQNPMHTMTLSPPVAPPMSSKERFAKTGGRFTAHFQALLSKRPSPKEYPGSVSAVQPSDQHFGILERSKPIESNPRKQSLSTRRGLEPPAELVVTLKVSEPKPSKNSIVRRAKSLGNIRKDDLRIRHQASPSLPFIPPVPTLRSDAVQPLYLSAPFTNSTVASSAASGITYMSTTSTQPTSAEASPIQDKRQPLPPTSSPSRSPSRATHSSSPQLGGTTSLHQSPSRSSPMSRPKTSHSNSPLDQSGPPPSKPLPKLPPALSAFPAPGPPPPLTQLPPQLFGPPKKLETIIQPAPPVKPGKRIGIMGSKRSKPQVDGIGLGIAINGELSPKELKKERKEEKEREKRDKKEKKEKKEKEKSKCIDRPAILPLHVECGVTVAIAP